MDCENSENVIEDQDFNLLTFENTSENIPSQNCDNKSTEIILLLHKIQKLELQNHQLTTENSDLKIN